MLANEVHATVGDLAGALELVMDRAAIDDVVGDLHDTITELDTQSKALQKIRASAFGASSMGTFVHGHSDKAYEAVIEALGSMNAAMEHYIAGLKDLAADTTAADDSSTIAQTHIAAAVECTTVAAGGAGACSPVMNGGS